MPRVTQQEARGQDSTQVSLAVQGVLLGLLAGVAAPGLTVGVAATFLV